MKTNVFNLVSLAFFLMIAISCEKETSPVSTTGIVLSKNTVLINVGSQDTLKATISPSDATNTAVTWTSSNTAVATVSTSGVVKGVAPGLSTITATTVDGKISASSKVNTLKWTRYTTANGLAVNQTPCVAIDSTGSLWFGGSSVSRFDGASWTTYLDKVGVGAIAIDKHNNKWFGTYGVGVRKFDNTNWTTYDTSNSGIIDNSISNNSVAVDLKGDIWFGTISRTLLRGTGVSRFDGANWKGYSPTDGLVYDDVTCIAVDAKGNKWFTTSKGISKFDGTSWTSYTVSNTKNDLVEQANSIAFDAQGNIWFGTILGLLKFDGVNWISYTALNSGLICSDIASVAIDKQGNKWIGTMAGGVTKFDGTNWTNYTYDNFYMVRGIAIDAHGNKWFATDNGVFELQD